MNIFTEIQEKGDLFLHDPCQYQFYVDMKFFNKIQDLERRGIPYCVVSASVR